MIRNSGLFCVGSDISETENYSKEVADKTGQLLDITDMNSWFSILNSPQWDTVFFSLP